MHAATTGEKISLRSQLEVSSPQSAVSHWPYVSLNSDIKQSLPETTAKKNYSGNIFKRSVKMFSTKEEKRHVTIFGNRNFFTAHTSIANHITGSSCCLVCCGVILSGQTGETSGHMSQHHIVQLEKKSFPLSSTRMKAGKFTTWIFQTASIPRSSNSTTSTLVMHLAKTAAAPPTLPK